MSASALSAGERRSACSSPRLADGRNGFLSLSLSLSLSRLCLGLKKGVWTGTARLQHDGRGGADREEEADEVASLEGPALERVCDQVEPEELVNVPVETLSDEAGRVAVGDRGLGERAIHVLVLPLALLLLVVVPLGKGAMPQQLGRLGRLGHVSEDRRHGRVRQPLGLTVGPMDVSWTRHGRAPGNHPPPLPSRLLSTATRCTAVSATITTAAISIHGMIRAIT